MSIYDFIQKDSSESIKEDLTGTPPSVVDVDIVQEEKPEDFKEAVTDIFEQVANKDVDVNPDDVAAVERQVAELSSSLESSLTTYSEAIERYETISALREEIIHDAGQCDFLSAEQKLSEALILSKDFLSLESVSDPVRGEHLNNVDPKKHHLLKTYSSEAINFLDAAIAIGKKVIQKIIDGILFIYRLIKGLLAKILGRTGNIKAEVRKISGGKAVVEKKALPKSAENGDGDSGGDVEDQLRSYLSDTEAAAEISIPLTSARALWNFEKKTVYQDLVSLSKDIKESNKVSTEVIKTVFFSLTNTVLGKYNSLMTYVYTGVDDNRASSELASVTREFGEKRMGALEEAINGAFHDSFKMPSVATRKVYYPGIAFKEPSRKKELDMVNAISYIDVNKNKLIKECQKNTFKVPTLDQFMSSLEDIQVFNDSISSVSDQCEDKIREVEKVVNRITEMSGSVAGKEQFSKFFVGGRNLSSPKIAMALNTSILAILNKLAQRQLDAIKALNTLTAGVKSTSSTPGIIRLIANELDKDLGKKGEEIVFY